MFHGHGGVVIGSETSGGIRNITASNLYMEGTDRGIRLKSTRGRGGVIENVKISNVVIKNMLAEGITINSYYTKVPQEPVSARTPIFRDIYIRNVTGTAKTAIEVLGLPEMPIRNVELIDVRINGTKDISVSDVENLRFTNVSSGTIS